MKTIMLLSLLALSGCYHNPLTERNIKADKITVTISSPWTTTTVQAEGWDSSVKAQAEK